MIISQKNINNNRNKIPINAYVLLAENYIKIGKSLKVKFYKKGEKKFLGLLQVKGMAHYTLLDYLLIIMT